MMCRMPLLNGQRVRHRAALLGWDLHTLAAEAALPVRAVQNSTRTERPQTMKITRIYALGRALAQHGEDPVKVSADIVADPDVAAEILANNDGVPDTPPTQPTRKPAGPARRETTEKTKGPRRNNAGVAA